MLKETKRTLALVLALIMMFGTFSGSLGTAAYADEAEPEEQVQVEYPEFRQSAFIDWEFDSEAADRAEQGEDFVNKGLHLALSAPEGVFPEGSELKVALRDYADVNLSVSKVREAGYNVRQKYCFQVGVYGADGETYISPDTKNNTVPVTVTIGIDELPDKAGYSKVSLYRTSYADKRTDVLFSGKELEGNTITAEAYGLGYWTLEFEYLLTYRLKTDEEVLLKDICDYHHLSGTPSQVISSAPGLFTVTQNEDGDYVVKALSAFGGAELELWYDGVKYSVMLDAVPGNGAAEEEEAEEAEETEEEETEELEEGYRIAFTATEGGKVAFAPEAGAEAELKESLEQRIEATSDLKDVIAVADEGYAFKGWMYKGEKFHEGKTFTWANVPMLEDSGFVAAFVKTYYEETTESGVTVSVTAPVGAFPEGTVMKVRDIEADDEVLDAVKSAVADGSVVRKVQAVDISFWAGGEEIEPNGKIQVKITSDLIREASTPQIVHVPDAEDTDGEAKVMATDPVAENSDEMSFESDRFSTYVVAEVLETEHIDAFGNVYDVIVTYTEEAKIPADSKVVVKEYAEDTDEYISAREKVIADKKAKGEETDPETLNIAVLDISIEDPTGAKFEPSDSVHVDLKIKSLPEVDDLAKVAGTIEVQHLNERSGEVETVASAGEVEIKDSAAAAEFDIDSFSTFTLTWGSEQSATIHWGTLNEDDTFVELQPGSEVTMDTTAATISLLNSFEGYIYTGAVYCTSGQTYDEGASIDSTLTKKDGVWYCTKYVHNADDTITPTEAAIANGSDIYVTFGTGGHGSTPSGQSDEIASPTTTKTVHVNTDGSATITLDIAGDTISEDKSHYPNVLVILDATRSMNGTKWTNAKAAMNTLIETLEGKNDENAGKIDFALVTFGRSATVTQDWTKNNTDFKATCAGLNTVTTSGTNWEAGMRGGLYGVLDHYPDGESATDHDQTYVIFLTDGDPNVYYESGSATNYTNSGTTNGYGANSNTSANRSADEAKSIAAMASLYGIYCGSSGTTPSGESYNRLVTVITGSGQGGIKTIAANADTIESEFQAIAETILQDMSPTEVSVDDGIPALSSISANVPGTPGGYDYYISNDGGKTFSEWEDAPGATYSSDNGVTWDLSEEKELEKGTVCRIVFTVWPSQEAYDIVANLNNHLVDYDTLPDSVQSQIGEKTDGTYYLKTNTHLNTTYTFNGETYTDSPSTLPQGEMPLVSYTMNVNKFWDDSINDRNRTDKVDFYLLVGGKYYQNDGTFADTTANAYILETSKDTNPAWTDSVQIAPGFATVKSGNTLDVKEAGHKYVLEEIPSTDPNYDGYSQEFTSQTVRPMVIDGTLTSLVLVDADNPKPDGATTYTIDGETYFVNGTASASLTGTNHKTAELDITKAIDGSESDKTEAQLNEETFTYEVTFTVPEGGDVTGINYWIYEADASGWTLPEYDSTGAGAAYAPYGHTNGAKYGGTKTTIGATSSPVTATVTIKRGQVVRFTNLPTGTTYKIVETQANSDTLSSQGYTVDSVKSTNGTASKTTIDNDTITGEIEAYNTRYYNQFTNKLSSVDQEIKVKKVTEGYTIGDEKYIFTISADDGTPMPEETSVTIDKNTTDLTETFGTIRFTKAGTYTYTITETNAGQVVGSITYGAAQTITVKVELVNGKLAVTEVTTDGLATVTNTEEKANLKVTKTWDDANNQDGKRPASIKVTLSSGQTATLNAGNNWSYTWTDLPVYANGQKITYSVTEDAVASYTATYDPANGTTLTAGETAQLGIKNSYTPEKANLKVTKTWDDANNQDGKRPESVTVTLSSGQTATLNAGNNWSYTWTDLPVYANGQKITYSVTEDAVESYTTTYTPANTTLTNGQTAELGIKNSYTPEKANLKVTKTWDDANNQDGKRPESVTVTLSSGQTATLNARNNWTYTWEDLPVYANGEKITYSVTEREVASYTATYDPENGTTLTTGKTAELGITNSYTPEKANLKVTKTWDDADDQDGKRPESVTVTLSNGETATLNAGNNWTYTWEDLPVYANGQKITYSVTEDAVESYTTTYTPANTTLTAGQTAELGVTNAHTPEKANLKVTKTWDDANNQDGKRPESITVTLSSGQTATLNAGNNWTYTWEDLPVYANGEKITYSVTEREVASYTATYDPENGTTLTTGKTAELGITNSYTPEKANLKVTKTWDDEDDQDGKRPESVTVTLSNGETATLNAGNNWTYTWEDLPVYANGQKITYSVTEDAVESYTTTYTPANTTLTAGQTAELGVTNAHTPEKANLKVTKTWDDADDQDGKRPESITVTLSSGQTATLNAGNNWSYTWNDLPVYANGQKITYSVTEDAVESYTTTYTPANTTLTAGQTAELGVTNAHTPEKANLKVTKTWDDANNQDGKRPESITVTLSSGQTATLNAGNNWTYTWEDLPVYENGEKITYSVTEDAVDLYTTTYDPEDGTELTAGQTAELSVTNSYTPEKASLKVTKTWDDEDDQDGKRPESVKVTLSSGQTATLNEDNDWSYTWEDLPVYENGEKITYSVTEDAVDLYTTTYDPEDGTELTAGETAELGVTNTHTPAVIEVVAEKVWDDNNNQAGKRDDVTFNLLADGEAVSGQSKTISKTATGDALKVKWTDLPVYKDGTEIVYTVEEDGVRNGKITMNGVEYTVTVEGDAEKGFKITNTFIPATTEVSLTKTVDKGSPAAKTFSFTIAAESGPDGVDVPMPSSTSGTASFKANETGSKTISFGNITYTAPGTYKYKVTEAAPGAGWTASGSPATVTVTVTAEGGKLTATVSEATITNSYKPEPVIVDPPVQKIIVNNDKLYNKGDFTFTIENTEAIDPTGAQIDAPMPEKTTITNSPDYELENRKGFYEFGEITFTEPGTYTYTVKESGSVAGVTNDPDAETGKSITFTVTDDGSGTLKVTPTTDQAQFTFTNTYKSDHVPKTDDNTNLDKWGIGAAICAAGFAGVELIDAIVKKRKKEEDEAK